MGTIFAALLQNMFDAGQPAQGIEPLLYLLVSEVRVPREPAPPYMIASTAYVAMLAGA